MFQITPLYIFVDRNNTVYLSDRFGGNVHVWNEGSTNVTRTISNISFYPGSLFVTINGDIYVGSAFDGKVAILALNGTDRTGMMNFNSVCFCLFVDIANYVYCSMRAEHRVVKQSLGASMNTLITVAGTGSRGSASNVLDNPDGIFVNINFDLYVADCLNNRVQLFKFGQLNGITVAGKNALLSIELDHPIAVFLDADDYLFILDSKARIIGSNSNGFYCLVGCSGIRGNEPYQLWYPHAAAFDSYGNILVADAGHKRIQKFILITNVFGK
jgi:hypothetical protein